jgi:branched-chain amino acid transport system substrate-binding protein
MKRNSVFATAFAALIAQAVLPACAQTSQQPYRIHVVLPLTGGASFVGKSQQGALQILEKLENSKGGLGGHPIQFVFHDDQTKPQITVQETTSVLSEKPSVIIAGGIAALCNSIGPLVQRQGPVDYCMTPAVHPSAGSFQYSSSTDTHDLLQVLLRYLRAKGLTKIAYITSIDASGQDFEKGFDSVAKLPENTDLKIVERQHFNTTDVSVSAQIEKIKASGAQVLIAWSTGAPIGTVFKGVVQGGLDIPVATTNGNQTYAQMAQYKAFLPKELYIPTAVFLQHDGKFKLDARVEQRQAEFYGAYKKAGGRPDAMSSIAWDPGLLVIEALRAVGPAATAEQLKTFLANADHIAGINGLYNFKSVPQRGLTIENALVSRWDSAADTWVPVTGPGGAPLN